MVACIQVLSRGPLGVGQGWWLPWRGAGRSHSPHTKGLGWGRQAEAFGGSLQFPTAGAGAKGSRAGHG